MDSIDYTLRNILTDNRINALRVDVVIEWQLLHDIRADPEFLHHHNLGVMHKKLLASEFNKSLDVTTFNRPDGQHLFLDGYVLGDKAMMSLLREVWLDGQKDGATRSIPLTISSSLI